MLAPIALCAGRAAKAWGVSTIQGRREEQEDRYAIVTPLPVPGRSNLAFFAVYDGHGGRECAVHAAGKLHSHLASSPALTKGNAARALADAFSRTEEDFLELAHIRRYKSGSTALTALLTLPDFDGGDGELSVAHVGDSRGVICRAGRAVALTHDHKPEDMVERKRIESLGGFVTERGYCMRVQGVLAMSRALGNRLLKPFVSAVPTVNTLKLSRDDEFFVLATDGLYDVFDNQEVVDIVRSAEGGPEAAARLLVERAYEEGSADNITAIVVALKGYPNYAALERGETDAPEARAMGGVAVPAPERKGGRKGWFFGRVAAEEGAGGESGVPRALVALEHLIEQNADAASASPGRLRSFL